MNNNAGCVYSNILVEIEKAIYYKIKSKETKFIFLNTNKAEKVFNALLN